MTENLADDELLESEKRIRLSRSDLLNTGDGQWSTKPSISRFMDLGVPLSSLVTGSTSSLMPPDSAGPNHVELQGALTARVRRNSSTIFVATEETSSATEQERYLWCFMGREDAGLVNQERHLVECALLAKRLDRTFLSPPLIATGMDPASWPRFLDELVDFDAMNRNAGGIYGKDMHSQGDGSGSSSVNSIPGQDSRWISAALSSLKGLSWASGSRARVASIRNENNLAGSNMTNAISDSVLTVDIHASSDGQKLPRWLDTFLNRHLGVTRIRRRRHGKAESLKTIGAAFKAQQTIMLVFSPDEPGERKRASASDSSGALYYKGSASVRATDTIVATLRPIPWLGRVADIVLQQLFGSIAGKKYSSDIVESTNNSISSRTQRSSSSAPLSSTRTRTKSESVPFRYMAMHLVRGGDLVKCLQKSYRGVNVVSESSEINASSTSMFGEGGDKRQDPPQMVLDEMLRIMRQCFQADSDVEAVISTVRRHFGADMAVYLTSDEKSGESLDFFQRHGYRTRLDSAVVSSHLRPTDGLFLDHIICRDATLFIGSSKSKTSKQIVSLREAIGLPSFILKTILP